MTYYKLSSELVKDFWEYMSNIYESKTVTKSDSAFMKTIGWMLGVMGVQDKTTFMNKYTTTIGKTIYAPFEVGSIYKDFASQISTCVHEHQHIVQYANDGFRFTWDYLFHHDIRAKYEAEAYTTNMEMHYWLTGKMLDTTSLANKLSAYGCNSADILVAKTILDINVKIIKYGGILNEASQIAIEWLNENTSGIGFKG